MLLRVATASRSPWPGQCIVGGRTVPVLWWRNGVLRTSQGCRPEWAEEEAAADAVAGGVRGAFMASSEGRAGQEARWRWARGGDQTRRDGGNTRHASGACGCAANSDRGDRDPARWRDLYRTVWFYKRQAGCWFRRPEGGLRGPILVGAGPAGSGRLFVRRLHYFGEWCYLRVKPPWGGAGGYHLDPALSSTWCRKDWSGNNLGMLREGVGFGRAVPGR